MRIHFHFHFHSISGITTGPGFNAIEPLQQYSGWHFSRSMFARMTIGTVNIAIATEIQTHAQTLVHTHIQRGKQPCVPLPLECTIAYVVWYWDSHVLPFLSGSTGSLPKQISITKTKTHEHAKCQTAVSSLCRGSGRHEE